MKDSAREPERFISPIFLREKSDVRHCFILNSKTFNELVDYKKFKMKTLVAIIQLIRPGAYMKKLDLNLLYTPI